MISRFSIGKRACAGCLLASFLSRLLGGLVAAPIARRTISATDPESCERGKWPGSSDLLTLELVLAATSREQQTLTAAQIDDFESILSKSLAAFFASDKSAWERAKENPNCGSALRMLEVDYGACDLLRAAYQAAGGHIYAMVWPIKTAMWIDPGSVKVRYGYGATVVELTAAWLGA
jgi:hypothetical protein